MLLSLITLCLWNVLRIDTTENIALGKIATMSSNYGSYVASRAVDGNTNNNMLGGSCSHTSQHITWQWWQVDLGHVYSVTSVVISNRGDCCTFRLANFTLELSVQDPSTLKGFPALTSESSVCFYQATAFRASPPQSFQCNSQTFGRYLRLVQFKEFAVCEVEVYGDLLVSTSTASTTTTTIAPAGQMIKMGKWKCVERNQMACSRGLSEANFLKNIFNCASRSLSGQTIEDASFIQISISSGECRLPASLNDTDINVNTDWVTYKLL